MERIPTARDVMSGWFMTLSPETALLDAIDVLVTKRASGAPVVDATGKLVGVLTEKDCLRILSHSAFGDLAYGTVADYMSPIRATVDIEMDLFAVAEVFLSTNFPTLPVMERGRLVGRVSRQDMLRQIREFGRSVLREKKREEEALRIRTLPKSINELQSLAGSTKPEHFAALMSNRHHS